MWWEMGAGWPFCQGQKDPFGVQDVHMPLTLQFISRSTNKGAKK
jgi:hypothetical protein